jgi:hypothetical protein
MRLSLIAFFPRTPPKAKLLLTGLWFTVGSGTASHFLGHLLFFLVLFLSPRLSSFP